jgi:hypothetical protein
VPATFRGLTTLGGTVQGLNDAFVECGDALVALRDELLIHLPCLAEAIELLAIAKVQIRIPAVVDFEAQLNAAVAMGLQLTANLTDPIAYLRGLLAGVAILQIAIPAMLPQVALTTQIAANASVAAAFAAKIAAVDLQLSALVTISAILSACSVALTAVAAAAYAATQTYAQFKAYLETSGAYAFTYTGTLGGLGAALDLVTPSTGLAAGESIRVTVQVVRTASTAAVTAHDALFTMD